MSLRTKLLVSLAAVIIIGISLASWAVYRFARHELETSKQRRLAQDAEMLARQTKAWLQKSKSNVVLWTKLPVVRQLALKPGDSSSTADACGFFQRIVETTGVYQTINLMSLDAACIASSKPDRIGRKHMQEIVARRPDFKEAVAGKATISPMFVSAANGRPVIGISAPVWQGGKVIAVVRAIIDMAFFDDVLLKPEKEGSKGRAGILDPNFEMKLPKNFIVRDVIKGKEYRPLDIPVPREKFSGEEGLIQYYTPKGDILAAFHRIKEPGWIIMVEEPLQEVVAPIRNLARVAFLTAILLIGAVVGVVFFIVNPRLHGISRCLNLVQEIGSGNLQARLDLGANDEIGRLAKGLNNMAASLQEAERERQRAEETESHLARSRLQALRYQINPHFLFNILNSIDALAKQAPQRVPELIRELSRYLRFTLTEQTNGLVPLHLELDAIASYLKLEKIRFEEDLAVEINSSPECGQALVPELLVQPLVENAIKFGMKTSPLPLRIGIRCTLEDKLLKIEVANTGKWISGIEDGRDKSGIGLMNLRQRLDLLYPDTYLLKLEARKGWIIAKVELPLAKVNADAH